MNKICKTCDVEKGISFFNKKNGGKLGVEAHCIECKKLKQKEYYVNNKTKFKEYYQENREKQIEYSKKYNKDHSDEKRKYIKKHRSLNKDKYKRYDETKRERHFYKIRAREILYNATKTKKIERSLVCVTCGIETKTEGHHYDYDKPLDVVWCCRECHDMIHANTIMYKLEVIINDEK